MVDANGIETATIDRVNLGIDIANADTLNSGHNSEVTANTLGKASDFIQRVVAERLSDLVEDVYRLNQMITAAGESNGRSDACLKGASKALEEIGAPTQLTNELSATVHNTQESIGSEGDTIGDILGRLEGLSNSFKGISERTSAQATFIAGEHLPQVQKTVEENTKLRNSI